GGGRAERTLLDGVGRDRPSMRLLRRDRPRAEGARAITPPLRRIRVEQAPESSSSGRRRGGKAPTRAAWRHRMVEGLVPAAPIAAGGTIATRWSEADRRPFLFHGRWWSRGPRGEVLGW